MNEPTITKPYYGNWVSIRFITLPGIIGIFCAVFAFLWSLAAIPAVLFLLIAGYFAIARTLFARNDLEIQRRIWDLVQQNLDWDGNGKALDIGCGSGALTLLLANKYPQAQVTGVDDWGASWEYSKTLCENNARLEGVAERVQFQRASAVSLPFEDGEFDAAVSNLVFHEVHSASSKKDLILEALRVVKPGGAFAFQDLFHLTSAYGSIDDLIAGLKAAGISQVEFVDTCQSDFIPGWVRLPFMMGTLGLIKGRK